MHQTDSVEITGTSGSFFVPISNCTTDLRVRVAAVNRCGTQGNITGEIVPRFIVPEPTAGIEDGGQPSKLPVINLLTNNGGLHDQLKVEEPLYIYIVVLRILVHFLCFPDNGVTTAVLVSAIVFLIILALAAAFIVFFVLYKLVSKRSKVQ